MCFDELEELDEELKKVALEREEKELQEHINTIKTELKNIEGIFKNKKNFQLCINHILYVDYENQYFWKRIKDLHTFFKSSK